MFIRAALLIFLTYTLCACASAQPAIQATPPADTVEAVFEPDYRNARVMAVEAAIAAAQAEYGIIPQSAADEIARTASTAFAPLADVEAEYDVVRHRMVALLNVWRRSLSQTAGDGLHLGVTTVDVYDTVMVLQLLDASALMIEQMQALEQDLVCLAQANRDTPMIGRTLGQHALPITFGAKVSVWAAQNRRNIDRLHEARKRLASSGVLKGAVGTYLGLGDQGMEIEASVSARLGLAPPEPADWRAARDVFAEYAQVLALIARSNANIGGEVFRLQSTDIGEVQERRAGTVVGSSTMPHKRNPSLSEALIYHGRTIAALAEIVLADVENVFERDNTSRPNETLGQISIEAAQMLNDARRLVARLEVDPVRMRANIDLTDGMIMSQRVMLHLAESMSREDAETRVRLAAERSLTSGKGFRAELLSDPVIGQELSGTIDALLDPLADLGLAAEQTDATRDWIANVRASRGEPPLERCSTKRG
jgi:adenylosuccinate lyase